MCWKLGETTNDIFSEIDKEVKEPLNVEPVVFNKMFGNTNIIGGKNLLVLLSTQPSVSISHFDGQLGSTLNNDFPLSGRHRMGNLSAELVILCHEDLQLLRVLDSNLEETVRQHMLGPLVRTITNVRHLVHSLELPSHSVVNTLRFTPLL